MLEVMEKRRRVIEEGTDVDRISELPEPILHHIQSLLHLKQAATTSALSKTWNTVWSTFPFLNFDENFFRPRTLCPREAKANNTKLIAFIDKTLHHRRRQGLRILKFEISTQDLDPVSIYLISWIRCLTVCNIDELIVKQKDYYHRILLPPSLLTIESLTSLSLKRCKLPFPSIDQVKLPNLRKLSLEAIDMDDQLLSHFISICHKLEYLLVDSDHGIRQLQISGLPYLKILITNRVKDLRVEASNLQELAFHRGPPPLINPAYCGNALKCLTLSWVWVEDNGWFSRLIPNLHVLETLSLDSVSHDVLQISSSSLKHLNLCEPCTKFEAKINAPNLQSFMYKGLLLYLLLTNCLVIGQVEIWISDISILGDKITKLIQLLGKFNHSQVVKLSTTSFQIPVELRERLLPPLLNVKHFMCCGIIQTPGIEVTVVLDSSLWLSSRLEVLSFFPVGIFDHFDRFFMISLKLVYGDDLKEDKEEEESCYCVSLPLRCWRHSLKTVEIEKFRCWSKYQDEVVRNIKYYFMANSSSTSKSEASCIFTERHVSNIFYPTESHFRCHVKVK